MRYEEALQNCIFRFVSGSHAYGTNIQGVSDFDYRGVFIAPLQKAFELFQTKFMGQGNIGANLKAALESVREQNIHQAEEQIKAAIQLDQGDLSMSVGTVSKPGEDEELQELRKFMKLAADCNPNIIEFLYVDRMITLQKHEWEIIRSARSLFLSKRARWAFGGYAAAQLKRIKTHRGYLLNPPAKKPDRRDYNLPLDSKIQKQHRNALLSLPLDMVGPGLKEEVARERAYEDAMTDWQAYQKWERERNPARKQMEAKHGYDVKHAMHLVRLIRMAKEILRDGTVIVYRPDRDELIQIRNGEWPFEKILDVAGNADEELDELYKKSTLRDKPDHKGISNLYMELCEKAYGISLNREHEWIPRNKPICPNVCCKCGALSGTDKAGQKCHPDKG